MPQTNAHTEEPGGHKEPFPPFPSANIAASEPPRELQAGAAQFTMTTIESLIIKARNIQGRATPLVWLTVDKDALKDNRML